MSQWIESSGARAAPILYTDSAETQDKLISSLNGFLFTGGGADFFHPGTTTLTPYGLTGQRMLRASMDAHANGETVPLWGTCLGFQLLSFLASGPTYPTIVTGVFDSENLTLPLDPTSAIVKSRFFAAAKAEGVYDILTKQAVTMNNHHYGVTPENFAANKNLTAIFGEPLTTNKDRNGKVFVSTIEGLTAPLYGSQWHPEKPIFEWRADEAMDHSADSVRANLFAARWLGLQARGNQRSFPIEEAEAAALIYNYDPVFTGDKVPSFEQSYFFE